METGGLGPDFLQGFIRYRHSEYAVVKSKSGMDIYWQLCFESFPCVDTTLSVSRWQGKCQTMRLCNTEEALRQDRRGQIQGTVRDRPAASALTSSCMKRFIIV